jgi:Zn-finger nucleic acid-binding protein
MHGPGPSQTTRREPFCSELNLPFYPFRTETFPMKCPHCPDATLAMTDRQGVEIDYCPQCRGVWLDRGELDKLIERAAVESAPAARPAPPPAAPPHYPPQHRPDFVDSDYRHGHGYGKKRHKSWLSDIFD